MAVKNRFNNLTSKEWLPFQKSWFKDLELEDLYKQYIRFFVKFDLEECPPNVYFHGNESRKIIFEKVARKIGAIIIDDLNKMQDEQKIQFALVDTLQSVKNKEDSKYYVKHRNDFLNKCKLIKTKLIHRRFLVVFCKNYHTNKTYYPFSWDLSEALSEFLSLKDEKIWCIDKNENYGRMLSTFETSNNINYCLHFRNDEKSGIKYGLFEKSNYYHNTKQQDSNHLEFKKKLGSWSVIRPKRRSKTEILHPAKYPEEIVKLFVEKLSNKGDNIFDPMSGTASTQLGSLMLERNGYGCELSKFFAELSIKRLNEYINPSQTQIFVKDKKHLEFSILNKDARDIRKSDFPEIDYILTSPPYWDMLNMAGAENQAKRKKKGLQTNYSESKSDLGNISDYRLFISSLVEIYKNIVNILKPGGFFTIIIKNIKKQGSNYPFAFDLGHLLQKDLILCQEFFWLQDDISIAPYGYGNTFVSNTFHQYCLTFQKPII